jgi:hypothetical protein
MHVKETKPVPKRATTKMKRLFHIFDLSENEQRVVLIVLLILLTIAFVGYERRVGHLPIQPISATEAKPSPTVGQIEEDR